MTVGALLAEATEELAAAGIASARLDVLILLEDVAGQDRAWLLAHPEQVLSPRHIATLNTYFALRKKHIPLAYIRGHAAFYGREFMVTKDVLVPRPESESMIALLNDVPLSKPTIADIGTGSGCLGITASLEIPEAQVFLYDTSKAALKVAAQNAQHHKVRVHSALQDLLSDDGRYYDVILTNLPYVPDDYPVNRAAGFEPAEALFSGDDGLDHYRRLWHQIGLRPLTVRPAYIITESLPPQHGELQTLATKAGYMLQDSQGLAQCFRRTT